jgi:hypothetical protein
MSLVVNVYLLSLPAQSRNTISATPWARRGFTFLAQLYQPCLCLPGAGMFIEAIAACRFDLSHLCRSASAQLRPDPRADHPVRPPRLLSISEAVMNSDFSLRELHENPSSKPVSITTSTWGIG